MVALGSHQLRDCRIVNEDLDLRQLATLKLHRSTASAMWALDTHHIIVDLQIHLASLEDIPGHAEVDAWIGKNAFLVAFGSRDQPVEPFQVFHICRPCDEEYLIQESTVFLQVPLCHGSVAFLLMICQRLRNTFR